MEDLNPRNKLEFKPLKAFTDKTLSVTNEYPQIQTSIIALLKPRGPSDLSFTCVQILYTIIMTTETLNCFYCGCALTTKPRNALYKKNKYRRQFGKASKRSY